MNQEEKRILVVDDDVSILRIFRRILEKAGYNVETVEAGKDAIEKLQNKKFNICLVDVRLPDIDGTELLLKMEDIPETIKIIFIGFPTKKSVEKLLIIERIAF